MGRTWGIIGTALVVTTAAHGEETSPPRALATGRSEAECVAPSASDSGAEERAFSAELESFTRRRAFTERLLAQRNAEFEQALERQRRIAELQKELTERERVRAAREFEEALALYLKKREFTRARAASEAH